MLTYVSLGAGVQSSALLVMSALWLRGCPKADVAIFADTQDEPDWVYRHLEVLEAWGAANGLPVERVTKGRLSDEWRTSDGRKRRAALPVFTLGDDGREAMLPRQCTYEFKIAVINQAVRARLGYGPRQRVPKGSALSLVGISFEERIRMKDAREAWITTQWPLIDAGMTRSGCISLIEAHGLPVPEKSSCYYCPFHDDEYWRRLKALEPHSFEKACELDNLIRDASAHGVRRPVYLHRSLIPLRDVTFTEPQRGFDYGFNNECEGHCGV